MSALELDIVHQTAHHAWGHAERLGFSLVWEAHAVGGDWTLSLSTAPGHGREPDAVDIVTDGCWPAFARAVQRALRRAARVGP